MNAHSGNVRYTDGYCNTADIVNISYNIIACFISGKCSPKYCHNVPHESFCDGLHNQMSDGVGYQLPMCYDDTSVGYVVLKAHRMLLNAT